MNHSITTKTEIQLIEGVSCYEENGVAYIRLEDAARGLGFMQTQNKNGVEYTSIRWERIEQYLAEFGFPHQIGGKEDFVPRKPIFYRPVYERPTIETAQKFTGACMRCDSS